MSTTQRSPHTAAPRYITETQLKRTLEELMGAIARTVVANHREGAAGIAEANEAIAALGVEVGLLRDELHAQKTTSKLHIRPRSAAG